MSYGTFSGNPKTEWLTETGPDRNMKLLEAFWYIDPRGRRWDAENGLVVDGASIPRPLWSSVGSPYTDDYRRASIVHDAAYRLPDVDRAAADEMFYYACLAGGCPLMQAKLLYAGVRIGTWAGGANLLTTGEQAPRAFFYKLPNQQSRRDLEIAARYTLIAMELETTPDNFPAIRRVVDAHLKTGKLTMHDYAD